MSKIITIDRCIECRYCVFNYRGNDDTGYFCTNGIVRELDDVETIPEWCELEEVIDAQRCVWTEKPQDEVWITGCGKEIFHPEGCVLYRLPFCPCCGHRIEAKEVKDASK